MDETKYAKAFELIMNAGNAKSLALMAVESAREFDFEEAQKQLKESQQEFHLAHLFRHLKEPPLLLQLQVMLLFRL